MGTFSVRIHLVKAKHPVVLNLRAYQSDRTGKVGSLQVHVVEGDLEAPDLPLTMRDISISVAANYRQARRLANSGDDQYVGFSVGEAGATLEKVKSEDAQKYDTIALHLEIINTFLHTRAPYEVVLDEQNKDKIMIVVADAN